MSSDNVAMKRLLYMCNPILYRGGANADSMEASVIAHTVIAIMGSLGVGISQLWGSLLC
jgi:hypothetical protein